MIERIRIRNYRSLHDVDVRLEPLTVLIGRSGSGKSNFVRAVRLLRDVLAGRGQGHEGPASNQPFGGGAGGLAYELDLQMNGVGRLAYSVTFNTGHHHYPVLEEKLSAGDRVVFHHALAKWLSEPAVTPHPGPGSLVLGTLTGVREATIAYVALTRGIGSYDFPGTVLQENAPLERGPGYSGAGDTPLTVAGRILDAIERLDDWGAIGKSLVAVNPQLKALDLLMPGRNQLRAGVEVVAGRTLLVDVAQESEGFRRYLAHLLALYQTPPKQTMLFEHPEHGIHPGAMEALFEEFKTHVEDGRGQVVLTTHSPQFLDYFRDPGQVRVVTMDGGQTKIGPLAADQSDTVRHNLLTTGELLTVDPARIEAPAEAGV